MPYLFHSDLISLLCGFIFALIKIYVCGIVGKSASDATMARARLFLSVSCIRSYDVCMCVHLLKTCLLRSGFFFLSLLLLVFFRAPIDQS